MKLSWSPPTPWNHFAPSRISPGEMIHVQRSTSYYRTLQALQDSVGPFTIVEASEELEIEDLVAAVGEGTIPLTVADSHLLDAELAYRDDVQPAVFLPSLSDPDSEEGSHSNEIAFGTRKNNSELWTFLDRFIQVIPWARLQRHLQSVLPEQRGHSAGEGAARFRDRESHTI